MHPKIIRTRLTCPAHGLCRARMLWSDGAETEGYGLTLVEAEMEAVSGPMPAKIKFLDALKGHSLIDKAVDLYMSELAAALGVTQNQIRGRDPDGRPYPVEPGLFPLQSR